MATCDTIDIDLASIDLDVSICTTAFDVEIVQADVTLEAISIAGQGPKGDKGDQGDQGVPGTPGAAGAPGSPGTAASVDAGTTTTSAPGTNASVVNSGSSSIAIFDFTIPRGDVGATGPMGQGIVIKGSVPTHSALPATGNTTGDVWVTTDTGHGWAWTGTAWVDIGPIQGPPGEDGVAGQPGAPGAAGAPGPAGAAATVAAGPTVTGNPGTAANVTNTGSSSAAVFAFTIPRGDVGQQGPAGTPGSIGIDGAPGAAGGNAWTLVTNASFTVPAYGGSVTVSAGDTSWVALGEWIYIDDANGPGVAGQLVVTAKTPTTLTLFNPTSATYPLATSSADGLLRKVSGQTSDFVDGTNNCQALAPQIWSARLRSYNAIGNPSFEVDQRNVGGSVGIATNAVVLDRWSTAKVAATYGGNVQQISGSQVLVPGTSFVISRSYWRVTMTVQQASLAAGDYHVLSQAIEGPQWRELMGDVHSVSLMVRSSVAGLNFGLYLRDPPTATKTLTKLCTIPAANTWTLITLPNLPVWPAGNFSVTPGVAGYILGICLACGTTNMSPANDTWQNGSFIGAVGQSNFAASPVNSTFDIAFVQHEPGPVCTTLIDKPFTQNLDECLRYFSKSYSYGTKLGTVDSAGCVQAINQANQPPWYSHIQFPKVMAKVPTVTGYSPSTGAVNNVRNITSGVDLAIASSTAVGDAAFAGFGLTPAPPAALWASTVQYSADTGW